MAAAVALFVALAVTKMKSGRSKDDSEICEQDTTVHSMHNPQLHTALLRHLSTSQDQLQQVLANLLQTSQDLQAAVAQVLPGQLQAALSTDKVQQADALAQWLHKHAGLLQTLDLQLISSIKQGGTRDWAATTAAVAEALQQAAAGHTLRLQSFTLEGAAEGTSILQPLAAAQLTRLAIAVPERENIPAMTAVAALTLLRSLDLTFVPGAFVRSQMAPAELLAAQNSALQPLAGLQQLTELRIGPMFAWQLQNLPPSLQQLHATISVDGKLEQLLRLARWVGQRGSVVSSLKLVNFSNVYAMNPIPGPSWDRAVDALGEGFAAIAHAAAEAAECSTPAAFPMGLQLQSLSLGSDGCAATLGLLEHLPAHSLTHLELRMGRNAAAQLVSLCQLTALRSLNIGGVRPRWAPPPAFGASQSVLVPLTELQQLTELQLPAVLRAQLMQLHVPRLQQLTVRICSSVLGAREQLQLSHMTALTRLHIVDVGRHRALAAGDQLPPCLRELHCDRVPQSTAQCSVQPLLALTLLQKLYLELGRQPPAAAELAQLGSLSSLQEVALIYDSTPPGIVAAHAQAAWPVLPLVQLGFLAPRCTLELQASVVHDLGAAQGLSHLCLRADRICTKPSELAAVLRHLPALQCLEVFEYGSLAGPMGQDVKAVSELLEAVGGLQELSRVHLRLAMKLAPSEVQALQGQLQQLLRSELAACCTIEQGQLELH